MTLERSRSELEALVDAEEAVIKRVKSVWADFADFILHANVLQVATGLIVAKAFSDVVLALVNDIILPICSLLPFLHHRTLDQKFAVLRRGPHYPYNTNQEALDDGAITMAYGDCIAQIVNFCALGLFLYCMAHVYTFFIHGGSVKQVAHCGYCQKPVSGDKVQRCENCTSWLDGREDKETSALR